MRFRPVVAGPGDIDLRRPIRLLVVLGAAEEHGVRVELLLPVFVPIGVEFCRLVVTSAAGNDHVTQLDLPRNPARDAHHEHVPRPIP